ncbi:hypothetical protein DM02DRAFT_259818 [Periconia macrospinosa]|uniref:Uncharacterized protein n=1 Tax=Periconia macrospinosa TaxID=97972 RepID=A0A2V1D4F5_9PLEO|nr:hypothetical protein DM02DRAFT_259818 [Periconia macrospinosa]
MNRRREINRVARGYNISPYDLDTIENHLAGDICPRHPHYLLGGGVLYHKARTIVRPERTKDKGGDPTRKPSDTGPPNTSPPNTSPPNTSPPNTSPPNTSPPNTSPPNTSPPNTNPPNTSPPNTSPPNTNPPNTNPPNTNPRPDPDQPLGPTYWYPEDPKGKGYVASYELTDN